MWWYIQVRLSSCNLAPLQRTEMMNPGIELLYIHVGCNEHYIVFWKASVNQYTNTAHICC